MPYSPRMLAALWASALLFAGCGEEACHPEIEGSADAYEFGALSTESVTVGDPVRVEWDYDCYTVHIEARGGTEDPGALGDLVLETSRANGLTAGLGSTLCGPGVGPDIAANDWATAYAVARALTARLEAADLRGSAAIVVEADVRECMRALGS